MPRRKSPPRLYLDTARGQWIIRDGASFVRTGCAESDREGAEKRLAEYLGEKFAPQDGPAPLIAEVLQTYALEHLAKTKAAKNASYNVSNLARWWGDKNVTDVTPRNCREYAATKSDAAARRDLETLRAAINHWHKFHGPLAAVPSVILPDKHGRRERWLTRSEAARLLWSARHTPHLARFILLGLYTGSRSGVIRGLQWDWINTRTGIMYRRAPGTTEDKRKKTPQVRLGSRILAHLRRWHRLDGKHAVYVCHYNGQPFGKLRRSWSGAVKRAKLSQKHGKVTPHTLRHTRATWLMQRGVDRWQAAGHLGMSVEMLERNYGHHHPDYQRQAAAV